MNFGRIIRMATVACCALSSPFFLSPQPPLYQIIRGQYEDKIRRFSPPQKIFYVFATRNEQNHYTMSLQGILKAICFYNYSEPTESPVQLQLNHIKRFLGKDGGFEIYDYFNLARFLCYHRKDIQDYFKLKDVDELDRSLMTQLMLSHICADYDTYIREPIYIESRQFKPNKQTFLKTVMKETESILGPKGTISFNELIELRRSIMRQLYTYEFKCFKSNGKEIDGVDFARSIVKYAQNNLKRKFLRRINTISSDLQSIKIDQDQYVNFHFQLQIKEKEVEEVLSQKGALSRNEIKELMSKGGKGITDGQAEVFFRLLDTDDSGFIEKRQILGVISSLGYYWNVKSGDNTVMQVARQRWNSFQDKVKKIQQIILDE